MDPRDLQRLAREFFAADNALRAAPVPTEQHKVEYVVAKARLDAATADEQKALADVAEEVEPDGGE